MNLRRLVMCSIGLLTFTATVRANAQTLTCPPLRPDAPPCRRFHYHLRAWQPVTRTFAELSATADYATRESCDAARAQAQKTSQSFAEQVKSSKIDGNYQADVPGECHCDMTHDPASRSFLDDDARMRQRRTQQDLAWQVREKLLDAANPAAAQLLQATSPPEHGYDRFLAEKLTAPPLRDHVDGQSLVLMDTAVAAASTQTAIAHDLPLLKIEPQPAPPGVLAAVPPRQVVAAVPPPLAIGQAFFAYETARLGAVVNASEVLAEGPLKSSIRAACEQRRQVLANLEMVANASDRNSRLVRALERTTNEEEHVALLRALFGAEAAASWAPADAKDAIMRTKLEPHEVETVLAESTDAERRRTAVYFSLARYSALPADEARTLGALLNALLPEESR
jgi:hypothetical protein